MAGAGVARMELRTALVKYRLIVSRKLSGVILPGHGGFSFGVISLSKKFFLILTRFLLELLK